MPRAVGCARACCQQRLCLLALLGCHVRRATPPQPRVSSCAHTVTYRYIPCEQLRTEWNAAADGSLWIRMTGELEDADLAHVVAVAYEVELWPRWVPLCAGAELLQTLGPMERVSWTQFELPMMKRSAALHWSLSDCFAEVRPARRTHRNQRTSSVRAPPRGRTITPSTF